jgi:tetratricopeptide (TPR) repeat protein
MSMLNEALRKKAREEAPKDAPMLSTPRSASSPGVRLKPLLIVLLIVAVITLGCLYAIDRFFLTPPASTLAPVAQPIAAPSAAMDAPMSPSQNATKETAPLPPATPPPVVAAPTIENSPAPVETKVPLFETSASVSNRPPPMPTPISTPPVKTPRKPPVVRKPPQRRLTTADDLRTAETFYEKGLAYHRAGRHKDAIRMYQDTLAKAPQHTDAMVNLAAVYIVDSEFNKAMDILDELAKLAPEDYRVPFNRGIAEIGLGRPDRALDEIDAAGAAGGAPQFDIYFHRGVALSRLGRFEDAIEDYLKAEALQSDDARLIFNMALAYDKLQAFPAAVGYYARFLDLEGVPIEEKKPVQARVKTLSAFLTSQQR